MCEALRDLMKEDFVKEREAGEARGRAAGEIIGAIKLYRDEMNLLPSEIITKIMTRFGLEKAAAEKYVEEALGLQLA